MRKGKFELFLGCLGNGVTVCNKAVEENGDYKIIAHIAECGKITWYVNPSTYVPGDALLRIEHCADVQREKWEKWLDSMPEPQRYEKLLNYTLIYQKISISTYSLHGNLLCDLLSVDASGCT